MPRSLKRVTRRRDVFYFRMAVPARLRSLINQWEMNVSLRTSGPLVAKVRGRWRSSLVRLYRVIHTCYTGEAPRVGYTLILLGKWN
ncbi:DUF6538 domain-containing protein [Aurantimonas sp. C2-6-R+9]|uniref:DUF6538 domain-containing protein n=1 Tax=unclassified Aurantimonas TaxID=2638230 RepID=UPI003FA463A5